MAIAKLSPIGSAIKSRMYSGAHRPGMVLNAIPVPVALRRRLSLVIFAISAMARPTVTSQLMMVIVNIFLLPFLPLAAAAKHGNNDDEKEAEDQDGRASVVSRTGHCGVPSNR